MTGPPNSLPTTAETMDEIRRLAAIFGETLDSAPLVGTGAGVIAGYCAILATFAACTTRTAAFMAGLGEDAESLQRFVDSVIVEAGGPAARVAIQAVRVAAAEALAGAVAAYAGAGDAPMDKSKLN